MSKLVWDKVGSRRYETGLDQGVLYLPDGSAVPWNGLTSVIENFDRESQPIYFDGMKTNDLVVLGDFSATMKAVTYPDEFVELEGLSPIRKGLFLADQRPQAFGLCYRTQIGNDVDGDSTDYKIHVIYNVTAIPSDKTYATISSDPSLVEFEWKITAVPEEFPEFRPSSHIVIDSRDIDPLLLEDLELILYGSAMYDATLVPMFELITFIEEWYRVQIVYNDDGTWTATTSRDEFISFDNPEPGAFILYNANAVFLNDVSYLLSTTVDTEDIPQIRIDDNGSGLWSATTGHDNLIVMIDADTFEIRNANVEFLNETTFKISDTTSEN